MPQTPSEPVDPPLPHRKTLLHECPHCGLMNQFGAPQAGMDLTCSRCGKTLRELKTDSINRALAYTTAAIFCYIAAVAAPMLNIAIYGRIHIGWLSTGVFALDDLDYWALAAVVFLTTVVFPVIVLTAKFIVLICARQQIAPHWIAALYTIVRKLGAWSMIEVYAMGLIVAYTRLEQIAQVEISTAVFAIGGLIVTMTAAQAALDPEDVWDRVSPRQVTNAHPIKLLGCDNCHQVTDEAEGQPCPRCDNPLHHRKVNSIARAWSFIVSAAILYIPSNLFPIMTVEKAGKSLTYTIFGGINELVNIGLWPLALLVFTASIAIPMFKIGAMVYMLTTTHMHSSRHLRLRNHLYDFIDFIGRWSMIDIFMVSILVALVRFGWFAEITPNIGALYFASVVVLTLFATHSFDPRLMWDAAATQRKLPTLEKSFA